MQQSNFISVLISVYYKDNPNYLLQSLKSIVNQTSPPSEIVLVKDGILTPELDYVINTFQTKYPIVKVLHNDTNIGLGLSLAKGVLECSNEIIARMDSDDISKPDRFAIQLKKIQEGYDVVSSWSEFFEGTVDNVIAIKRRPEYHAQIAKVAKRRSPLCHASSMFRKSAVLKAGNYKHCLYYEDYYLWLRMIKAGAKFYNIQDYIYCIRSSNEQFGRRGGWLYLKNELSHFLLFYKEGYYTLFDFLNNSLIRIFARLMPVKIRRSLYLIMWKNFN